MERITLENKHCLITGDLNVNLLDNDHCSQSQEFLDILFSSSCIPLINKPTRVTQNSATLIDNIFSNILPPPNSGILVTDVSDHFPIFTSFPLNMSRPDSRRFYTREYSQENISNFKNNLNSWDWSVVFNAPDPDTAFARFIDIFNTLHDKNIPMKSRKSNSPKLIPKSPWITVSLCKSIYHKNKLYRKYISHPTDSTRFIYVRYKNILTNVLRKSKQNYYAKQFENAKGNIKSSWKVINSVLHNEPRSTISSINIDGRSSDDLHLIVEHFNTKPGSQRREGRPVPLHLRVHSNAWKPW